MVLLKYLDEVRRWYKAVAFAEIVGEFVVLHLPTNENYRRSSALWKKAFLLSPEGIP